MKKITIVLLTMSVSVLVACGVKKEESMDSASKNNQSEEITGKITEDENAIKEGRKELELNQEKEVVQEDIELNKKREQEEKEEKEKQVKELNEKVETEDREDAKSNFQEEQFMTYDDILNLDIEFDQPDYLETKEIHELFNSKDENKALYSVVYARINKIRYFIDDNNRSADIIEAEITNVAPKYNENNIENGDKIKIFSGFDGFGLRLKNPEKDKNMIMLEKNRVNIGEKDYYELDLNKKYEYEYVSVDFICNYIVCEPDKEYAFLLIKCSDDKDWGLDEYYRTLSIYPLDEKNLKEIKEKFVKYEDNIYNYYGSQLVDLIEE